MTEGKATPLTRDQWLAECGKLARIYEEHMSMAMDEIEKKALAACLRAALAKRGLEIRSKTDG